MRKLVLLVLITLCTTAPLSHSFARAENVAPHDQKNLDDIAARLRYAFRSHRVFYMLVPMKDHIEVTIFDPKQYVEAHGFLLMVCADKQSPCSVKLLPEKKFQITPAPSH